MRAAGESRRRIPLFLLPRHSRESGNPDDCSQARYTKSSMNRERQIPSPFMGLLPYTFFAALNPVGNFSAYGIRRRSDNRF